MARFRVQGNKIDFTPFLLVFGFIFLFFVMFNPLSVNVESFIIWIQNISFNTFQTPEALAGLFFIVLICFLIIMATNIKSHKYFIFIPFLGLKQSYNRFNIQQTTQTIHDATDYNPLAWIGQNGNDLLTIGLVVIFIIILLSMFGNRRRR